MSVSTRCRFLASNWPAFSTIFGPEGATDSFLFGLALDKLAVLLLELSVHSEAAGALMFRVEHFARAAANGSMQDAAVLLRPGERLRLCLRRGSLAVARQPERF